MVEALDELLEKFELIEAKRRQEEKIDKLLEKKFELRKRVHAVEDQHHEEDHQQHKASTVIFKMASSPPQAARHHLLQHLPPVRPLDLPPNYPG